MLYFLNTVYVVHCCVLKSHKINSMVLDLVEKSTIMVGVTIEETLTISILLCCNKPHGYFDSIAIVDVLLQLYCDSFHEYLFFSVNALYFKKYLRSGGHTIQALLYAVQESRR